MVKSGILIVSFCTIELIRGVPRCGRDAKSPEALLQVLLRRRPHSPHPFHSWVPSLPLSLALDLFQFLAYINIFFSSLVDFFWIYLEFLQSLPTQPILFISSWSRSKHTVTATNPSDCFGHFKVRRLLHSEPIDPKFDKAPIIAQFSSMGSWSQQKLQTNIIESFGTSKGVHAFTLGFVLILPLALSWAHTCNCSFSSYHTYTFAHFVKGCNNTKIFTHIARNLWSEATSSSPNTLNLAHRRVCSGTLNLFQD